MADTISTEELRIEMRESPASTAPSPSKGPSSLPLTALSPARRTTLHGRRRPESKRMLWDLSKTSWLFLVLALIQVFLISALQIAIATLGNFRSEKGLSQYINCLNPALEKAIKCAVEANETISIPSFGKDKEIYTYLFLFLTIYNFGLCIYALKTQNYIELVAFVIINLLTMGYAALQVWQFRGFGGACSPITNMGYLALASVMALFAFTVVFITLSVFLYVEFGWKIYKYVDCNSQLIHCYRIYKVFLSSVKILILFTVVFSIAQVVLLLNPNDYEFGLTIVLVVVAILGHGAIYFTVRREWLVGYCLLLFIGVIIVPAYYSFKIQRYATQQCPTCIIRDKQLKEERMKILQALNDNYSNSSDPECMNVTQLDESVFPEDRSLELQNLVIVASVNLTTSVVVLCVFIALWRQRGKGLKEHFQTEITWLTRIYNSRIQEQTDSVGVKIFKLRVKHVRKKTLHRISSSIQEANPQAQSSRIQETSSET